jgi:hypothetical protein
MTGAKKMTCRAGTDVVRYVAGYGKSKHILDPTLPHTDKLNDGYGLCGHYGGYPMDDPDRPVCKLCQRKAAKS